MHLTAADIARATGEHPRAVQRYLTRVLGAKAERSRRVLGAAELEALARAACVTPEALAASWGVREAA